MIRVSKFGQKMVTVNKRMVAPTKFLLLSFYFYGELILSELDRWHGELNNGFHKKDYSTQKLILEKWF